MEFPLKVHLPSCISLQLSHKIQHFRDDLESRTHSLLYYVAGVQLHPLCKLHSLRTYRVGYPAPFL